MYTDAVKAGNKVLHCSVWYVYFIAVHIGGIWDSFRDGKSLTIKW